MKRYLRLHPRRSRLVYPQGMLRSTGYALSRDTAKTTTPSDIGPFSSALYRGLSSVCHVLFPLLPITTTTSTILY